MTDERDQRSWRRPEPGDGPDLRPRPYQSTGGPPAANPLGAPSEPDGTGVWKPAWDDDDDAGARGAGPDLRGLRAPKDDAVAKNYYVPPRSQAGSGQPGPGRPGSGQPGPGPAQGRHGPPPGAGRPHPGQPGAMTSGRPPGAPG